MSAHTPGPWEVGGPYPGVSVVVCLDSGHGGPDPEPPIYDPICIIDTSTEGEQNPRSLADARLIAAAPDMLDVLKTIENDGKQVPPWLWDRIQAVIAKATGREARA